jgi:hypothetical protein
MVTGELQKDTVIFDAPVGSVRLDRIRDGIEDYEYFVQLKKLDPDNELLNLPFEVSGLDDKGVVFSDLMAKHRLKIAREIERLKKK